MPILLSHNTKVFVQGITGKEGQKATRAMLDYGTQVIAGVRPGKGGEYVEGVLVYNSVKDVVADQPDDQKQHLVSAIYVPPFAAKEAILEAINNDIPLIHVFVERIPIQDTAYCLAAAKEKGIRLLGPSSLGCIVPHVVRLGMVGGPMSLANQIFAPGSIGVISRSGGMTNEVSWQIRQAGLGQSTAVHVGGDLLLGTSYAEVLTLFEKDDTTKAVVIYGEHGGSYEFEIIDLIYEKKFTKPLAVYIGGKFAGAMPEGANIGHAGAIVEKGKGAAEKEQALRSAGVMIAQTYEELVTQIKPFA